MHFIRFSALSTHFKDFHLFEYEDDHLERDNERLTPTAKRITEGWLTYSLLEIKQHYNIQGIRKDIEITMLHTIIFFYSIDHLLNYTGPLFPTIDESLNKYNDLIKVEFSKRWSKHKCSVPGCATVLIFDGGCKVQIITYLII